MTIQTVKTPFTKMSYTPDIPSGSLGANEYNQGQNVETDIRGIKKILGDIPILSQIPVDPVFVTGGFREANQWWFIIGCVDGTWLAQTESGTLYNITPTVPEYTTTGYSQSIPITASWNGNVLFINDSVNPPMYLLPTDQEIRLYDSSYNDQTPNIYVWNYTPGWYNLTAGFQRVYSAPNVGSILVAGNLSYTTATTATTVVNLPNTLRWSQSFGLNSGPTTWEPTFNNIANELEIPLRGPIVDGFALNGSFYLFSYWDCCVLTPIAYTNTAAPVFGVSPVTQGRGMLNENCFVINDNIAFGLDSSDIWVLTNGQFQEIGNQRVKNWFYENLNSQLSDQVFMVNNTKKNQVEIYFPDQNSLGLCNKMISYRYDLDCWNPPRDVSDATMACESPVYTSSTSTQTNISNRGVVYSRGQANSWLIQKDTGNSFDNGTTTTSIYSYFRRDNINYGENYSANVQVHRVLPEVYGTGMITVEVGGALSVGQTPIFKTTATMAINTDNPWIQTTQNSQRVSSVIVSSNDTTASWILTQANWQVTVTEETR